MLKKKEKIERLGLNRFIKGIKLNLSSSKWLISLLHLMDYKDKYFFSNIGDYVQKKKLKIERLGLNKFIKGKKLNLSSSEWLISLLHLMDYKDKYFFF